MIGLLSGDDDYPMCRRSLALAVGNVKSAQYKTALIGIYCNLNFMNYHLHFL